MEALLSRTWSCAVMSYDCGVPKHDGAPGAGGVLIGEGAGRYAGLFSS